MHRTEIDRLLHALRVALTRSPLPAPFDQLEPLLAGPAPTARPIVALILLDFIAPPRAAVSG
jgi:hypothetical protein